MSPAQLFSCCSLRRTVAASQVTPLEHNELHDTTVGSTVDPVMLINMTTPHNRHTTLPASDAAPDIFDAVLVRNVACVSFCALLLVRHFQVHSAQ